MPIPRKSVLSRTLACAAAFPLSMALVSCADDADNSANPSEPQFSDAVAQSSSSSSSSSSATSSAEPTTATTSDAPATSPAQTHAQQPTPQEVTVTTTAKQSKGDCSPASFAPIVPQMDDIVVIDCDGSWAHFGKDQTDWTVWARFVDGAWTNIEPIGVAKSGMTEPCYDVDKWINQGAPSFVSDNMRRCN
ncbi:hypothetical protein [Corynebacterium accolens]|uniref:hypothetical protein n=1 Tax=Corynebacterium accolens TaxID=38284 RepID=UPI00254C3752|nr:hypothetical protein [Corynebacterium accolens]MDK8679884.1 hypothetical protein [Corynebacterium accolens]